MDIKFKTKSKDSVYIVKKMFGGKVPNVDLEEGETKRDWCNTFIEMCEDDGSIKIKDGITIVYDI